MPALVLQRNAQLALEKYCCIQSGIFFLPLFTALWLLSTGETTLDINRKESALGLFVLAPPWPLCVCVCVCSHSLSAPAPYR